MLSLFYSPDIGRQEASFRIWGLQTFEVKQTNSTTALKITSFEIAQMSLRTLCQN